MKLKLKTIITVLLFIVIAITFSVGFDYYQNSQVVKIPKDKPKNKASGNTSDLLKHFIEGGQEYDSAWLGLDYIDARYAKSDFKFVSLIRIVMLYKDRLTEEDQQKIQHTMTNYKYWMTDPGQDSMCYWSENHQILYSMAEYLAGQLYPKQLFTNTGLTGEQHKQRAKQRLLTWLQQRWNYGFIEWYSNTYYKEDISPLANLVDFAEDEEIKIKSQMILDLLIYDMASQSYKGTFVTTMGRGYASKKMSGESSSMKASIEFLFGFDVDSREKGGSGMDLSFIHNLNYQLPPVLYDIAHDQSPQIIKASQGLNLSELAELNLIGTSDEQIMMQWGMESFSNPEVIANSLAYIEQNEMQRNADLYAFKAINFSLLKKTGLLPAISTHFRPQTNGTSMQRANTYTYKTPAYSMYTAQSYHPGEYGDQHHISGVTLSNSLSVFHNHPAVEQGKGGLHGNSPTYWVGYGYLPHSAQYENINISLYRSPEKKSLLAKKIIEYTHAYFPKASFDEIVIDNNLAFGRLKDAYVAFITHNPLHYRKYELSQQKKNKLNAKKMKKIAQGGKLKNLAAVKNNSEFDLIQPGKITYWITETSDKAHEGGFKKFIERISLQASNISYDGMNISYQSKHNNFDLTFGGEFKVNKKPQNHNYLRYDSPFIKAEKAAKELQFNFNNKTLYLNFDKLIRTYN